MSVDEVAENLPEQEILVQSVCETMVPKLVAEDIPLLFNLLSDVFPGVEYTPAGNFLTKKFVKVCLHYSKAVQISFQFDDFF